MQVILARRSMIVIFLVAANLFSYQMHYQAGFYLYIFLQILLRSFKIMNSERPVIWYISDSLFKYQAESKIKGIILYCYKQSKNVVFQINNLLLDFPIAVIPSLVLFRAQHLLSYLFLVSVTHQQGIYLSTPQVKWKI